jgi:endonuclease YncB( thermonuclease family)
MPLDVLTPPATLTITPIPDEALGLVAEVIDGETIVVVLDGDPAGLAYQVRYIGIDTPPNSSTDPWGVVAYETNQKLTNLKVVRLVRDETDFDDDGYLLRHVYVGNELVSLLLVQQGLARVDSTEPNLRFETDLKTAEVNAQEADLGIWGGQPPTPTPGRVLTGTQTITTSVSITPTTAVETTATPETETPEAEPTEGETAEATEEAATSEAEATEEETTVTVTATRTATGTPEPTEEATPENP